MHRSCLSLVERYYSAVGRRTVGVTFADRRHERRKGDGWARGIDLRQSRCDYGDERVRCAESGRGDKQEGLGRQAGYRPRMSRKRQEDRVGTAFRRSERDGASKTQGRRGQSDGHGGEKPSTLAIWAPWHPAVAGAC